MISSDQRPPGEDWLVRRIVDLERQVRELQAGRRLEAATIGAGGLTVKGGSIRVLDDSGGVVELAAGALRVRDTAGNVIVELGKTVDGRYGWRVNDGDGDPQVRAGELAGGGYGLEAVDAAGQLVSLLTIAFGLRADININSDFTASLSFTDLNSTVGPAVTTTIGSTGKCIVIVGCKLDIGATNAWTGGAMSFAVSGATSLTALDAHALSTEMNVNTTDLAAFSMLDTKSKLAVVEGLNPGEHTFTAKYKSMVSGDTASFSYRTIAVLPY